MTYPIIEQITQNIVATLESLSSVTVARDTVAGNSPADGKVIVVLGDPTKLDATPTQHISWDQPYALICYVIASETDETPPDQRAMVRRSDIEKALMVDPHRGGLAVDTFIEAPTLLENDIGLLGGVVVNITVRYRTRYEDPYQQ